jgi:hypothetical protein
MKVSLLYADVYSKKEMQKACLKLFNFFDMKLSKSDRHMNFHILHIYHSHQCKHK